MLRIRPFTLTYKVDSIMLPCMSALSDMGLVELPRPYVGPEYGPKELPTSF